MLCRVYVSCLRVEGEAGTLSGAVMVERVVKSFNKRNQLKYYAEQYN